MAGQFKFADSLNPLKGLDGLIAKHSREVEHLYLLGAPDTPCDDLFFVESEQEQRSLSQSCLRLYCPYSKAFTLVMRMATPSADKVLTFNSPSRLEHAYCKCCSYQQIEVRDDSNVLLGDVRVGPKYQSVLNWLTYQRKASPVSNNSSLWEIGI